MPVTTSGASPCVASSFPTPSLFGAEILSINAAPVKNYTVGIPDGLDVGVTDPPNVSFCNITVTYTHPGQDDTVNVETWLPLNNWNGKLQAVGGGGWVAGRSYISYVRMLDPIADGFVTTTTDAGQGGYGDLGDWALLSPGNVNLYALQDLGLVSLNDTASIAKSLIQSYYGQAPSYSYWNGCSQGGRQGLALAQRYPTAYDGILAAAPAINWAELIASSLWPVAFMQFTQQYPHSCELTKLTSLALSVCDALDGVKDGRIADPEACRSSFRPKSYIGKTFYCSETDSDMTISSAAVSVASAIWDGPRFSDGRFIWYGYEIGTNITPLAQSICTDDGECVAKGTGSITPAIRYFLDRDLSSNVTVVTHKQFDHFYRTLKSTFASNLETNDIDLSEFQEAGGKLLTYHGLTDPAIPPESTLHYYKQVSKTLGHVQEFYRYFRVPGLNHCWGGSASHPASMFTQLTSWVEDGTVPKRSKITYTQSDDSISEGIVCPYPKKAILIG
ncbi:Tannase/feruloyl esterase [Dactylonectria macrodidyma]|uniref:Carboxylic ester hydrolase n=1 Tax=Dactylonectria macrodidyma TaxID=307937 RepID=A0A9P9ERN8_9HYPO|nr:Tannase/feruloyl esterase [Dactylonectria macrodidyma]